MGRLNSEQISNLAQAIFKRSVDKVERGCLVIFSDEGPAVFFSQSKPSRYGNANWDYEYFSTLKAKNMQELHTAGGTLILVNYIDKQYVRLDEEQLAWFLQNGIREHSSQGEVVDFVVLETGGNYRLEINDKAFKESLSVSVSGFPENLDAQEKKSVESEQIDEVVVSLTSKSIESERVPLASELLDFIQSRGFALDEDLLREDNLFEIRVILQRGEVSELIVARIYIDDSDAAQLYFWVPGIRDASAGDDIYIAEHPTSPDTLLFRVVGSDGIGEDESQTFGAKEEYPLPRNYGQQNSDSAFDIKHEQSSLSNLLWGMDILVMPRFQRPYCWNKSHFDVLWSDIDQVWHQEEGSQFMGAIVTRDIFSNSPISAGKRWVIDGQQRLTTLYAVLIGIVKVALENDYLDEAKGFARALFVSEQCQQDKYRPLVLPTDNDLKYFNKLLIEIQDAVPAIKLEADRGENKLLFNGFNKHLLPAVRKRVMSDNGNVPLEKLMWLFQIVTSKLVFIRIDVPQALNPHKVFDRLNTQGKKLSIADLVRNLVFENLIDDSSRAEQVHNHHMLPFERQFNYEHGGETKSMLDEFYFPFALTLGIENLTKSSMYSDLRGHWQNAAAGPEEIISEMNSYAPSFLALALGSARLEEGDPVFKDAEMRAAVDRLNRLKMPTSTFSYMMPLLESFRACNGSNKDEVLACFEVMETYLVRRGFCGMQSAGFQTLFKTMWTASARKADARTLYEQIVSKAGYDFPDNTAFIKAIEGADLYKKKSLCRFVLNEYELDANAPAGHKEFVIAGYEDSTIEHIVPRNVTLWVDEVVGEWGWAKREFLDWHSRHVNRFANLLAIAAYENSQLQNEPWSSKRSYYISHAKYKRAGELATNTEKFGSQAFEERAIELRKWTLARWPYPNFLQ